VLDEEVPLCAFSGYVEYDKAIEQSDVKAQTLKPKSTVMFGVYGPWCVHEACDQLPSLQCEALFEGNTITVRSRYSGYHKDGSECKTDCKSIRAACQTPVLEAGAYTVVYGDKTFPLQIPSVTKEPCFAWQ
jgi:hypothetical protein